MSKPYKQFFHGKGIPKNTHGKKPMKWVPSTYLDTYNAKTGRFRARRKFGEDGWAYKDMDIADSHKNSDHIHDIKSSSRSSEDRNPTKKEQKELNKAKKKRKFWK